jgi:REP element-mobilizing transposase RayT
MLPERTHARLKHFDYASPGRYLITICTADRRSTFGRIKLGKLQLSRLGQIIEKHWRAMPEHHGPRVELDEFQIMPNHFHAIVTILPAARHPDAPDPPDLGTIIGSFKAGVTREWRRLSGDGKVVVWQARFHDHIIRHELALERIRQYVRSNVQQWSLDRENPQRTGENEFYRWLEAYARKIAAG